MGASQSPIRIGLDTRHCQWDKTGGSTVEGSAALVLEGGGFRGIFTAGALDVMQEHGIYGFGSVWGVSAGAINAASYKSKQIGRGMRIILAFRDDRRFMSLWSWATTGNIAGADFMYDEIQNRIDPCDNETFNSNPMRMYAVATDTVFGTAAYLPCEHFPEDVIKVRASASLPMVSNRVEINGHRYLDGGTADSIPYAVALGLEGTPKVKGHAPAQRAVVIATRERGYIKTPKTEQMYLRSHRYDGYDYYTDALISRADRYNESRRQMFELEEQGRVLIIEPPKPVEVGNTGADGQKLLELYLQGRTAATQKLDQIREFAS